jgi:hypothetical protein
LPASVVHESSTLVGEAIAIAVTEMGKRHSSVAVDDRAPDLLLLVGGAFRAVAALAGVITASRLYSYVMRNGGLDLLSFPSLSEPTKLLYTGPAILTIIVKLAVGLLLIGAFGWALAVLVRWTAAGLRADQDD